MKTFLLFLLLLLPIFSETYAQNFAGGSGAGYAVAYIELSPLGLFSTQKESEQVCISPNPVSAAQDRQIYVSCSDKRLVFKTFQVLDAQGRLVLDGIFQNTIRLPSTLSKGIYLLFFKDDEGLSYHKRIILE